MKQKRRKCVKAREEKEGAKNKDREDGREGKDIPVNWTVKEILRKVNSQRYCGKPALRDLNERERKDWGKKIQYKQRPNKNHTVWVESK